MDTAHHLKAAKDLSGVLLPQAYRYMIPHSINYGSPCHPISVYSDTEGGDESTQDMMDATLKSDFLKLYKYLNPNPNTTCKFS